MQGGTYHRGFGRSNDPVGAIVPPETLRDEIAARLATAEGRRDASPAKWHGVTPV